MHHTINEFRQSHGRESVRGWNRQVSDYCREHCWAMIRRGYLYHAEPCYLGDWAEIVAMCSLDQDWHLVERRIIYDVIGRSPGHTRILLDSNELAYEVVAHSHNVYLTIRGR